MGAASVPTPCIHHRAGAGTGGPKPAGRGSDTNTRGGCNKHVPSSSAWTHQELLQAPDAQGWRPLLQHPKQGAPEGLDPERLHDHEPRRRYRLGQRQGQVDCAQHEWLQRQLQRGWGWKGGGGGWVGGGAVCGTFSASSSVCGNLSLAGPDGVHPYNHTIRQVPCAPACTPPARRPRPSKGRPGARLRGIEEVQCSAATTQS